MRLNYLLFSCFLLAALSCKQKPAYNPFDNQFNIDESYFITDKLDTIWDTCGYYTLEKKEGDFKIHYGYLDTSLLGKGFSLEIDSIKLSINYSYEMRDSINKLSFNPKRLNEVLKRFDYEFYKQEGVQVFLINKKENIIDTAVIYSNTIDDINFNRFINFTNRNKKYKDW
ncbi:hypothetical protein LPB03_16450 [Polaribacter vadi]|mgnify:FL=1|uniref:Lipoprotein n=1 Tax=Polaribacter vadi TaxID=1774273 RepID=A0A1B8TP72_9FLAO|nr:hypothetical protein [Polaribacter vadi]AOW18944.1 hypothetical protein LPB03_16450 [Polaribacter vadi]OBY61389.1 hypothetical protein LPB3_16390 [Polaribacter vadi]